MLTRFNISSQRPISTEPEKGKRRREEGEEAMGLGRGCMCGGENPSRSWLLDWGRSGYRVASRRVIQLPNPSLCVSPEWLFLWEWHLCYSLYLISNIHYSTRFPFEVLHFHEACCYYYCSCKALSTRSPAFDSLEVSTATLPGMRCAHSPLATNDMP